MAWPDTQDTYWSPNYHKYATDSRLYRWHLRSFLDCVYETLVAPQPTTVLDAGCGEGFVIDYLTRQNDQLELTGVDLNRDALRYARRHFSEQATYRHGSLYDLPFPSDAFDAVLCSEVLEHLDEPEQAVCELKRVAQQHVVITVPREPYFRWINRLGQRFGLAPDPGHVNFWTEESFRAFINRHFEKATFEQKHLYQLTRAVA